MVNLLNIAIKYNKPGGSVVVRSEEKTSEDNIQMVQIAVIDTGIGISESDQNKLFQPFERMGAEQTQKEGAGLGLSVVQKLVKVMGGELGVESKPVEGSTFWLTLKKVYSSEQQQIKTNQNNKPIQDIENSKPLVLYLEDKQSDVDLVKEVMSTQRP